MEDVEDGVILKNLKIVFVWPFDGLPSGKQTVCY
jgi:hypothetical protein